VDELDESSESKSTDCECGCLPVAGTTVFLDDDFLAAIDDLDGVVSVIVGGVGGDDEDDWNMIDVVEFMDSTDLRAKNAEAIAFFVVYVCV